MQAVQSLDRGSVVAGQGANRFQQDGQNRAHLLLVRRRDVRPATWIVVQVNEQVCRDLICAKGGHLEGGHRCAPLIARKIQ